ncbi:MAG: class I SAM-dependent methyltransferase [Clostridia bacterium]|nr:class I SAM-dependent methyltransferase [Clostridia bacterium]
MKNSKEYYKVTKNNPPSGLIRRFFTNKYNEKLSGNTAIDLGCGVGNDTEFLISKGFKVTAVDSQEEVKEIFENKNLDKEKLDLIIGDFSQIELPKADLIFANMSLFFVKDNFELFLKSLLEKVNKNGFFVANFLGKEDECKDKRTTIEKDELLYYFKDFEVNYFSEEKYYKDTALGINKFWHVYTIMAKKVRE